MREDSPSQFVRFKKKGPPEAYATALVLVEHVSQICEHGKARPYLRNHLDRLTTKIVVLLKRGDHDVDANRWRHARGALDVVHECTAIVDVMIAQKAGPEPSLGDARDALRMLARILAADAKIAN